MTSISKFLTELLLGKKIDNNSEHEQKTLKLKPDKHSQTPDHAWSVMKKSRKVKVVKPLDYKTPRKPDHVRFVCISDTHTKLETTGTLDIPDGDVLLHAGDLTMFGKPDEVHIVNEYLGQLPHKYKVVIAGNHDMTFDLPYLRSRPNLKKSWNLNQQENARQLEKYGTKTVHEMMSNCIYLQDSMVELYGIKIFGSPWSPGSSDSWGFQAKRGAPIMTQWDKIPDDTDILITHGPPVGYGDDLHGATSKFTQLKSFMAMEAHVGCVDLLNTVQQRVKPRYHIYGHIHEGYGVSTDGTTTFINAAVCTESYHPINPPIIFDMPIPNGYTKDMTDAMRWIIPTDIQKGEDDDVAEEDAEFEIVFKHDRSCISKVDRISNTRQSSDLKQIVHQPDVLQQIDGNERNDIDGSDNENKHVTTPNVKEHIQTIVESIHQKARSEQLTHRKHKSPNGTTGITYRGRKHRKARGGKKHKDNDNDDALGLNLEKQVHVDTDAQSEVKDITELCKGLTFSIDDVCDTCIGQKDLTKVDDGDDDFDDFGDLDFPDDNSDVANIWNKWVNSDSDNSDDDVHNGVKIGENEKDEFQIIDKTYLKESCIDHHV